MLRAFGIRQRLIGTVVIAVLALLIALVSLVRLVRLSTSQRLERARETTGEEVQRAADGATNDAEVVTYVGMRAGVVRRGGDAPGTGPAVPPRWRGPLEDLFAEASRKGEAAIERPFEGEVTLVGSARALGDGRVAWAAVAVAPPAYLAFWRAVVIALVLATALLVVTAVPSVASVQRDAKLLHGSLEALAKDLEAPIEGPRLRELADVADGIRALRARLVEARTAERRLGLALVEKERLAALGRVVAGVAHEVRNPLATVKLRLDLATTGGTLPKEAAASLAQAAAEITRLDRLLQDLLVVSGRKGGPRAIVPLERLARDRVQALSPWLTERGIAVDVRGHAVAAVDVDAVARAMDNLVHNAVEASPAGGRVRVDVEAQGEMAEVTVVDTGAGVPREREGELFEPFFTTKATGTGLGLAVSRAIARAHGGQLAYQRRADRTAFVLSLPRDDRP